MTVADGSGNEQSDYYQSRYDLVARQEPHNGFRAVCRGCPDRFKLVFHVYPRFCCFKIRRI